MWHTKDGRAALRLLPLSPCHPSTEHWLLAGTRHQCLCARGHRRAAAWRHRCASPGPAQACTWACLCSLHTWTNPSLFCMLTQAQVSCSSSHGQPRDPSHHCTQEDDAPGHAVLCAVRDMGTRLGLQPCTQLHFGFRIGARSSCFCSGKMQCPHMGSGNLGLPGDLWWQQHQVPVCLGPCCTGSATTSSLSIPALTPVHEALGVQLWLSGSVSAQG